MNKFLSWCGRRAIESCTMIQSATVGVIIGLIIAGAVVTFVNYAIVILARWFM
jgi:hypothetical protein